jgi:bacterioferritin-associated ferredoxin
MKNNRKKKQIICRCNNVGRDTIEEAICGGCDTMNKIFDATTAGVGPCGGTCRRKLKPMLDCYLATGRFPETIVEDRTGKIDPETKPASNPDSNPKSTSGSSDENQ